MSTLNISVLYHGEKSNHKHEHEQAPIANILEFARRIWNYVKVTHTPTTMLQR